MLDKVPKQGRVRIAPKPHDGWEIKELWEKYEQIAMHFNGLLIRLRTQALAAVAALSTIASIFARTDAGQPPWPVATGIFFALWLFWIAIWVIDFKYYNRLLVGAVNALLELEKLSHSTKVAPAISMSTRIEQAVAGTLTPVTATTSCQRFHLKVGVWAYYILVFIPLTVALLYSTYRCFFAEGA